MTEISKANFKTFCFDLISSEVKLDIVIQERNEKGIRAIYCEVPELSRLKREYPQEKDLYKYIAKHIKDSYFHVCEYDNKKKLLVIDGSKYTDIILV